MANASVIADKIRMLEALKSEKDEHSDVVAELGKRIEKEKADIISMVMDLEEITGVEGMKLLVDGRNYSVSRKSFFAIPKDKRDDAFPLLRELGHGDLIVEKVDDRTLTKELALVMEQNGGELPEEYEALGLSRYDKNDLRSVKA